MKSPGSFDHVSFVRLASALAVLAMGAVVEAQETIRYRFAPDSRVVYDVKITAQLNDVREVREGTLTLEIEDVTDQETTVKASGQLGLRRQRRDGTAVNSMQGFGSPFPGAFDDFINMRPVPFTFDKAGNLVDIEVQTALPYLLGDFELLVLDQLPEQATGESWKRDREVSVVRNERSSQFPMTMRPSGFGPRGLGLPRPFGPPGFGPPGFGPPGAERNVQDSRSATETTSWKVQSREGGGIQVAKKYELKTDDKVNGRPRQSMKGDGEMTFDPLRGLWKSGLMRYEIEVQDDALAATIPVTVSFKRLTETEIAKRAEEASAAKARNEALMKKASEDAKPKALAESERKSLLADLKSGDDRSIQTACDRLAKAIVPEGSDPEIVKALVSVVANTDRFERRSAAQALVVWGSEKNENDFIKLLATGDHLVQEAAIAGLAKCQSSVAAKALAMEMSDISARRDVSKALSKMKPEFVEPEIIPLLESRDIFTRNEAIKILQNVGTEKSIPALEKLKNSDLPFADKFASDALKAIRLRSDTERQAKPDHG